VKRLLGLLAAAAALAAAAPAQAQMKLGDSPRWGSFQLSVGAYRPDIDAEFHGSATPYQTIFGTSRPLVFSFLFNRSAWITPVGTLDVGFGAGYWQVWGLGIYTDPQTGATSRGSTNSLLVIPIQLAVGYRLDVLYDKWNVPLEPYARVSLYDYIWSASNQGQVSTWVDPTTRQESRGSGQTFGWGATIGAAIVLDFFDPTLARQMDIDTGINRTLLFLDFTWASVDDFGSSKSWQLGPGYWMWSAGLQFVF